MDRKNEPESKKQSGQQARVLVVDDDLVARKNLVRLLEKEGYRVLSAPGGAQALESLSRHPCDLVISDLVMEGMSGMELMVQAKLADPDMEFILVTGYASIASAIEAVKEGAYHYLEKPFRPDEVRHLARQALEKRLLKHQVRELEARLGQHPGEPRMIGSSRALCDVKETIGQVAGTDCNVLLTGESGTGKELAALLLHHGSRRRSGPFVAINCGAFSEELLANELFGHEKDAYTGATTTRAGLFEAAQQGTVFLDEVGDMPLAMQVKLLRVIQDRRVLRVGGTRPVDVDVRVVAATNQDLKKAVSAGLFRQDLYFRLNVVTIRIPPLRERKEDIPLLTEYLLEKAVKRMDKNIRAVSDQAAAVLLRYDFPGNVRELENIVERAVALCRDTEIQIRDLPADLSQMEVYSFDAKEVPIKTLREMERDYVRWVLGRVGRNKTRAARLLGIDRASLWRRLKKDEIEE